MVQPFTRLPLASGLGKLVLQQGMIGLRPFRQQPVSKSKHPECHQLANRQFKPLHFILAVFARQLLLV